MGVSWPSFIAITRVRKLNAKTKTFYQRRAPVAIGNATHFDIVPTCRNKGSEAKLFVLCAVPRDSENWVTLLNKLIVGYMNTVKK